ncbi:anti-sigma factor domain-containing protein [Microbacterium sp. NPDC058345]|uniref:anti-sigma factor n=1 Tax=Microbacterium sp. NPDC058345 TaxID=3346455 RepID=UPI003647CB30
MNRDEFAELAAGHALRALSDADEQRFQHALSAHPEWSDQMAADEETAAALSEALTPVAPPPAVRDRLLAAIAGEAADATPAATDRAATDPAATDRAASDGPATLPTSESGDAAPAAALPRGPVDDAARGHWSRRFFALAASFVLLVGLGVGAAIVIPQLLQPEAVSALERIRSADDAEQASIELPAGGEATAHWSETLGSVVLVADGLDDLDEKKTYELWFVRGDAPVAAGTFRPEGGDATALLEGRMRAGDVIAVTVEPAGGSPTGMPTSDPIIVIPTA